MKAVAETLAVARSNLVERVARPTKPHRAYRKAADEPVLVLIRRLVDERPTYGYRRITRLVNRQQKAEGKPAINAKRVLRIMQVNKLTLERHTGRRPGRTHDGVVIALRSNIRWCSDHFELACRNGELLRILFAIDACDREVMAWSATTAGISGEMVRDLMVVCVERRFGTSKTPHFIEWLSDNGSAYIAKDTLHTATALGLQLCFTPVRSPQSNGIAEAFVKTFKRDYVRLSILPDAATVIALLPAWFEDYNEVHPHSGLKFLSPREFLRLSAKRNQLPVRSNGVHTRFEGRV
jgi:transposase InsO family protein